MFIRDEAVLKADIRSYSPDGLKEAVSKRFQMPSGSRMPGLKCVREANIKDIEKSSQFETSLIHCWRRRWNETL